MISDKKRIALINPPSFFLTDDKVFFSLGLLYVAAVARKEGHIVHIEDLAGRDDYKERAVNLARNGKFDIYGITATSPQYGFAVNILDSIKSEEKDSRVVIGGPHANMFANLRNKKIDEITSKDPSLKHRLKDLEERLHDLDINFKSLERFDQIIEGEENGIFRALEDLKDKSPKKWIYSGIIEDLDSLPYPARDLIDLRSYTFKDDGTPKFDINGGPATSVMSQRGCPFGCLFCSGRNVPQYRNVRVGNKFRGHTPERMIGELNHLNEKYGFTRFMIYDDELNLENKRFGELMSSLEANNMKRHSDGLEKFNFRGFVKSELFLRNPEQAKLLKKAGFIELLSGFESGSDRILKCHVVKNTTPDINIRAIEHAFKNGLQVKVLTMIGHPTETYEDIRMTRNFIDDAGRLAKEYSQNWNFDITIFTPYPGSPIYDRMIKNRGEFSKEYPRVLMSRCGSPELFMKEVDFATEGIGAYKTAPGEEVVLIRTPTISSRDLYNLRNEIDVYLRNKYNLKSYAREISDIEHAMGQS